MRKIKGFTLTELMIALAVIGIIVAVVTPAIMKTRPNKNKMMIKKTYYTTEQIVSSLINDERLYPDMRDGCDGGDADIDCYYGFDYTGAVTYEDETYSGNSKFQDLFRSKLNVKSGSDTVFYTMDGVKWDISDAKGWTPSTVNSYTGKILIDVNGEDDPNCRENESGCDADDFDQYVIEVYSTGKMKINANDEKAIEYVTLSTSINDNSTSNSVTSNTGNTASSNSIE